MWARSECTNSYQTVSLLTDSTDLKVVNEWKTLLSCRGGWGEQKKKTSSKPYCPAPPTPTRITAQKGQGWDLPYNTNRLSSSLSLPRGSRESPTYPQESLGSWRHLIPSQWRFGTLSSKSHLFPRREKSNLKAILKQILYSKQKPGQKSMPGFVFGACVCSKSNTHKEYCK